MLYLHSFPSKVLYLDAGFIKLFQETIITSIITDTLHFVLDIVSFLTETNNRNYGKY